SSGRRRRTEPSQRRWGRVPSGHECLSLQSDRNVLDHVNGPLTDAFEVAHSARFELDPRPCDEVTHGSRDEHLTFSCLGSDARPNYHGEAGEFRVDDIAFAGVDADPDSEPKFGYGVPDRACATNGARGTVESGCEEPIARSIDLAARVPGELTPDSDVVLT